VIVREGRVIGRGWTRDGGRPHAETVALAQAGAAARGATAYVTLEPCNHHGQTPPCSRGAGRGAGSRGWWCDWRIPIRASRAGAIATLRAAGIDVETGLLEAEARRDQAGVPVARGARAVRW
jgi:diaminohydroxyphosphoribosylaminopyrimidine deaminase/5-amino-6-(5-phosphoribosylamino)uracil reductase